MTDVKAALHSLGWRVDTTARLKQSIKDFQAMWNLGEPLAVDGVAGPATEGALAVSLIRKASGLGDISPNFSAVEFQCNCGEDGRTIATDCRRIWTPRSTVQMAERFRTLVGPYSPERACRCPRENKRVGGTSASQHLYGRGLDVPIYTCTVTQVRKATGCDGVGTYEKNGRLYVRHIDNRGSWAQWPYPYKPFTPLTPAPEKATTTPPPAQEEDDMYSDADRARDARTATEANYAHIHAKAANTKADQLTARVTALEAAVGVLANSQGLNPDLVQKTISDAVSKSLANIKLTTEETP